MGFTHLQVFLITLCLSCGEGELLEGIFKGEDSDKASYPEFCEKETPAELATQIAQANEDNSVARANAVAAEQARHGVQPLKPTQVLGRSNGTSPVKPTLDPFPNSIVAVGDLSYDIRANGYQLTHGMMNQFNVYETEPGSRKFFIVDILAGDGLGSKDTSTDATTITYGLHDAAIYGGSWHSWHANADNLLIRAKQETENTVLSEIAVCGCGNRKEIAPNAQEISAASDASFIEPQAGVFMLPGSSVPKFSSDTFNARFQRSYIKIRYIPREGSTCREEQGQVVC